MYKRQDAVGKLDIRPADSQLPVGNLSGGNQQKVVIGKWLARDLRVLLIDEPTAGIDIGAKDEIYKILDNLAEQGVSILLVSSDLQELLRVSHRILVFRKGHIQKEFDSCLLYTSAGKVRYYVSDFPNPKVANMERVILLPHLGASTKESEDNCAVMAVKELTDYLENGNIKNSVNFPSCDMGICQAESRVAVLHMNIPNMIGQITAILAEQGMNISDMTNKSRDKYAYTLLDLEHKACLLYTSRCV